jgi:hypothetical protein
MTRKNFYQDDAGQWHYRTNLGFSRPAEVRKCQQCGNEFPYVNFGPENKGLYCSTACANKASKPRRNVRGEEHPNWQGGRIIDRGGYVRIRTRRGKGHNAYELEHRLVMAEVLGRPLNRYEQVHHKNGNKTDNRPENLELRVSPHGAGATEKHCPTCTCFEHAR